ncbi:enoyl-CoA hydratase/isomerase family protein [Colwellia sp. 4_MG-2023]|uniref:enoyl-CoA hydratase/isomerase family protein n=1 Tax=unclassified Colwellia TaxID=196834 RepID=UPI0026E259BB|nr:MULTISPECIES: enoyl-CoA hydratase/isomerase family protein [unclassified Colwellia]MDO6489665.1 enoyl-CoA hydratase/isomerase family protein [Colwellia sp. 6_MG-2023]MDO6508775.1 enoyl-CoA hydratase/isomerase family protein [Colwellia sp. 5_MG-2023]MDO6557453.1 enoyl-CoA hydratase/isomerase family protein [Colwellia sp. 4_MG-2023]
MNTSNEKVLFAVDEQGVATVTLNNPDKHNAFDDEIIKQLTTIFNDISKREDISITVLASNGKSFSAGADLGWMKRMASYSYQDNLKDANALAQMLKALNFLPQTTIAKIQGAAFGGAVGLASCCDIVIASTKASFCLSEVKLGLIPATISPYVVDAIGLKASRRYFQTAERFFSEKAQQLGLVDEIVDPDDLTNEVKRMITILLANGSQARRKAKKLSQDVAFKTVDDALLTNTSERIAAIRVSEEGQEGLNAFFEKRLPNWQK